MRVGQDLGPPGRPQRQSGRVRRLTSHLAVIAVVLLSSACQKTAVDQRAAAPLAAPIPDSTFGRLVTELSGPGAYFDTDNLISNETSYLHVVGALERLDVSGGVYIGVGPDQNFSYMAAIRPRMAFILDIRRDNMLQQLMFKALFEAADDRVDYLALLTGRPPPADGRDWSEADILEILDYVDRAVPTTESERAALDTVAAHVGGRGVALSDQDMATIRRFHRVFIRAGLDLQFQTHGRPPLWYYPTFRELLLQTDLDGERANYLASEEGFQFLKEMQERNLVIPVVGDFAGEHALPAIGRYIGEIGEQVSSFYTSNVEFYLMGAGTFDRFAASVVALPRTYNAMIIRSVFRGPFGNRHPQRVPGYFSTQLLQPIDSFAQAVESGGFDGYSDLVTRGSINLQALRDDP